ncbi:uncharacterized protein BDR25DRAFT_307458 [Lindgomyces ingoldianus]|uniref:Uncharacterized protein n=1 Tax=Lindgomyces ingoldianus TaxID=673940 RepID=A0ACB6QAP5_9PLEO|nr:uncharacterized protein BDR25DRAFT_307458 [Lindgomyces ingoldianus]KAF2463982.1 hypothetical protein BDR25DRAFT_307458 [Lindgomyces ingoldianus]
MAVSRSQLVGSGMTSSRPTNSGTARRENSRQIVIDVSRVREDVVEKVATTEAARQTIQQDTNGMERLAGAKIKGFHGWRANNSPSVMKFSADKDNEAAFRLTTTEWLEPRIQEQA